MFSCAITWSATLRDKTSKETQNFRKPLLLSLKISHVALNCFAVGTGKPFGAVFRLRKTVQQAGLPISSSHRVSQHQTTATQVMQRTKKATICRHVAGTGGFRNNGWDFLVRDVETGSETPIAQKLQGLKVAQWYMIFISAVSVNALFMTGMKQTFVNNAALRTIANHRPKIAHTFISQSRFVFLEFTTMREGDRSFCRKSPTDQYTMTRRRRTRPS